MNKLLQLIIFAVLPLFTGCAPPVAYEYSADFVETSTLDSLIGQDKAKILASFGRPHDVYVGSTSSYFVYGDVVKAVYIPFAFFSDTRLMCVILEFDKQNIFRRYSLKDYDYAWTISNVSDCASKYFTREQLAAFTTHDTEIEAFYKKDLQDRANALKEKAKQGNTEAQWQLYHLQTTEENLVWLCRAADQGQVDALAELGNLYLYGSDKYRKFQNVHILKDLPRACMWFHLADLAKITEKTVANIPSRSTIYESDEVKRTAMVMTADELAEAEKLIKDWKPGQCEHDFSLSLGMDYLEESELVALCLAADQGKMSAREELGRRYFFGSKNIERDLPHAYMWYHLAAKVYLPPYMPDNQFICDAMTPKQRLIAIKYLEEWKPGMCEQQLLQ